MRRSLAWLALGATIVVGACAAAGAGTGAAPSGSAGSQAAAPIAVTDALGRQMAFSQAPKRIVLAGKALFMVADALYLFPEAAQRVVAIGSTKQNKLDFIPVVDPTYASKMMLDSSAGAEQIAAATPDLVLLKSSNADSLGKPLEALGIPVVYVDFETPDQYQRDLTTLGQLLGDQARAEVLKAYFANRVQAVTTALGDLRTDQKPRVLLLYYSDKNGAIAFNVPPLTYIQSIETTLAGGTPVWKDAQLGSGWTTVTFDQIAAWDPDQIYIAAYSADIGGVIAKLKADPQWQALRATRLGQLHGFRGDYYSWDQPDPRWALGLTWLASSIHPEKAGELGLDQTVRGFYKDLYGLDDAAFAKDVLPNLTGDVP